MQRARWVTSGREWILPAQTREAREVAIRRHQRESVLDRERSEMRIVDEIGARGGFDEQAPEDLAVILPGLGDKGAIAIEPLLYLLPCRRNGLRPLEDPRIRHEAQEGHEADPGKADARCAVQSVVQPLARCGVLREGRNVRVNEKV